MFKNFHSTKDILSKNIRANTHPFVFKEKSFGFHNNKENSKKIFLFLSIFVLLLVYFLCTYRKYPVFVSTKLKPQNVIQYFIVYFEEEKKDFKIFWARWVFIYITY